MMKRKHAAEKLKRLLIGSSPRIEEYTAAFCPACTDVCCRQRHGLYRERDVAYLRSLGIVVPERDTARPLDGPCESMGPQGCILPRWMRPFKCTWYFCDPLIKALNEGPQRKARQLTKDMEAMLQYYDALGENDGYGR